jgi:tripartite ATP-independent transporter DctP family solute receptor
MTISRRALLGGAVGGAAVAVASPSILRAQAPVAFRVSSSMPADKNAAHFVWFERFQALAKERIGDKVRLDYFANSQLGREADVVQQVVLGSTDIMITGSSIWATTVAEWGMLDLGYVFDSQDHAIKAIDAGLGDALGKLLLERRGAEVLGWGFHFGARNVYTKANVKSLADLKGVKLRVLPAPAFIETFKIMGAVPVPIPFNELYTALQTGVVDGFEHDAASVIANRLYEVTKHCYQTDHLFSPMVAVMGKRGMSKIPAEVKTAFLACAQEATTFQRAEAASKGSGAIEELKGLGLGFTPMPKEERAAILQPMSEKLYADFAKQYPPTKALFEMVAKARG